MPSPRFALFIDGGFFTKRLKNSITEETLFTPKHSETLIKHIRDYPTRLRNTPSNSQQINSLFKDCELYRCFYYDCPPSNKSLQRPISKQDFSLKQQPQYSFYTQFHEKLKQEPLVALRMGKLASQSDWRLDNPKEFAQRFIKSANEKQHFEITDNDFTVNLMQKGVDMRIGLDIASVVYKQLADTIILISGDSDFIPAAKMARREGCRFFIDPMGQQLPSELFEHIDGIVNCMLPFNRPFGSD
ncbi:MAG: NYN domain-containing protein [Vampirovibrionales bacterium]